MKLTISTLIAAASFSSNAQAAASEYCSTLGAEFMRQQTAYFNPDGIFIAGDGESKKHTPFITVSDDGKSAKVVVGDGDEEGGVWHPMTPSDDPNKVHWITHIMVKDQDGFKRPVDLSIKIPKECINLAPVRLGETGASHYTFLCMDGRTKASFRFLPLELN